MVTSYEVSCSAVSPSRTREGYKVKGSSERSWVFPGGQRWVQDSVRLSKTSKAWSSNLSGHGPTQPLPQGQVQLPIPLPNFPTIAGLVHPFRSFSLGSSGSGCSINPQGMGCFWGHRMECGTGSSLTFPVALASRTQRWLLRWGSAPCQWSGARAARATMHPSGSFILFKASPLLNGANPLAGGNSSRACRRGKWNYH